jgi:DNA invertase Pin-like site-specific DNA recombinase
MVAPECRSKCTAPAPCETALYGALRLPCSRHRRYGKPSKSLCSCRTRAKARCLQNYRLGYARVSNYGQTIDAQLEQLRSAGCTNRNIYREKVTGARADRRELLRMLDCLGPGCVVTVTRIDGLARSTFDLFAIVNQIVDTNAQFRSAAEPWADTGTSTGRLMLAVLGGLADVERDLANAYPHRRRQEPRQGPRKAHGPAQQKEATRRRAQGATLQELADSYDRTISTMRRNTRAA